MVALAAFMTACSTNSNIVMAEPRGYNYLRQHRAHDVRALLRAWRKAIKGTPFQVAIPGKKDGFPLIQVGNGKPSDLPGFYVSTGIHGDEPAPPWGLLEWFLQGGYKPLGNRPILLFPCLNPLGITENHRVDGKGRDLNRIFDQVKVSPIREVRAAVKGLLFHTAICLHEDYDAQGAYLYDLNRTGSDATGRALLAKATNKRLPIDGRKRIDGRKAKDGVLYRQRLDMRNIPGLPEAVFFYVNKLAERTLTFETPSEFALTDRIDAHRRFLTAAARACC
jgi:murein peptide amidase A